MCARWRPRRCSESEKRKKKQLFFVSILYSKGSKEVQARLVNECSIPHLFVQTPHDETDEDDASHTTSGAHTKQSLNSLPHPSRYDQGTDYLLLLRVVMSVMVREKSKLFRA